MDFAELAAAGLFVAALVLPLGLATGLFDLGAPAGGGLARAALIALVVPALGEELVFRAALVPGREEHPRPWAAILLSTALFVGWHVVEGLTFLAPHRSLLLRWDFLLAAGLLGLACAALRWRSGGIWTAILLHWACVVAWKGALGGPDMLG